MSSSSTGLRLSRESLALAGMHVGLSGAMPDPDDLLRHGWSDLDIRLTVARLVEVVLREGGTIVHGSHPTFVPVIRSVAESYCNRSDRKPVVMFLAGSYLDDEERAVVYDHHARYADIRIVGPAADRFAPPEQKKAARKAALAEMRRAMIAFVDALVCVGGRGIRPGTEKPGVAVECELALQAGIPVYLAAGVGGFTAAVREKYQFREETGLTAAEDEKLASTSDPTQIALLVRRGLERIWHGRSH